MVPATLTMVDEFEIRVNTMTTVCRLGRVDLDATFARMSLHISDAASASKSPVRFVCLGPRRLTNEHNPLIPPSKTRVRRNRECKVFGKQLTVSIHNAHRVNVHCKLFENGSLQMAGNTSVEMAENTAEFLSAFCDGLPRRDETVYVKQTVYMMQATATLGADVDRDALHASFLANGLTTTYAPEIYAGVKLHVYEPRHGSSAPGSAGVCRCAKHGGSKRRSESRPCSSSSAAVFKTGKVVLTAPSLERMRAMLAIILAHATRQSKRAHHKQLARPVTVLSCQQSLTG